MRFSQLGSWMLAASLLLLGNANAQNTPAPLPDPSVLLQQAVEVQQQQAPDQASYRCRYHMTDLDHYGLAAASRKVEHTDETTLLPGSPVDIRDRQTGKPIKLDGTITPASPELFDVWTHSLFRAIAAHSILAHESRRIVKGRPAIYFRYAGNPAYRPVTDADRIAQVVAGSVGIDEATHLFVFIEVASTATLIENGRFLMQGPDPQRLRRGVPLLEYGASFLGSSYVPEFDSEYLFQPVRDGPSALVDWWAHARRVIMFRDSCQVYHVDSKILPGFKVVDPPPTPAEPN